MAAVTAPAVTEMEEVVTRVEAVTEAATVVAVMVGKELGTAAAMGSSEGGTLGCLRTHCIMRVVTKGHTIRMQPADQQLQ